MNNEGFVQDSQYASHFENYRSLLNKVLNHDPAMFDLPKDALIGDIGCGYGDLLGTLQQRGYTNLIGVEPDPECRAGAQRRGLDVRDGTLAETGIAAGLLDVAIVNAVFHHVDHYARAIDELHRILKPGGTLCFLEPAPTPLRSTMDFLTFKTPLPRFLPPVKSRYDVMILEMNTGMYPMFLSHQNEFFAALDRHFEKLWLRRSWFFQFGKYRRLP